MQTTLDHLSPPYRYRVRIEYTWGRGFHEEWQALQHFDEEVERVQKLANERREPIAVSVRDLLSEGKDKLVAMHICIPQPGETNVN